MSFESILTEFIPAVINYYRKVTSPIEMRAEWVINMSDSTQQLIIYNIGKRDVKNLSIKLEEDLKNWVLPNSIDKISCLTLDSNITIPFQNFNEVPTPKTIEVSYILGKLDVLLKDRIVIF